MGYRFVKAAAKGKIDKFPDYADRFLESAAKVAGIDAAVRLYEQLRKAGRYACCQADHLANAMTTYQARFKGPLSVRVRGSGSPDSGCGVTGSLVRKRSAIALMAHVM